MLGEDWVFDRYLYIAAIDLAVSDHVLQKRIGVLSIAYVNRMVLSSRSPSSRTNKVCESRTSNYFPCSIIRCGAEPLSYTQSYNINFCMQVPLQLSNRSMPPNHKSPDTHSQRPNPPPKHHEAPSAKPPIFSTSQAHHAAASSHQNHKPHFIIYTPKTLPPSQPTHPEQRSARTITKMVYLTLNFPDEILHIIALAVLILSLLPLFHEIRISITELGRITADPNASNRDHDHDRNNNITKSIKPKPSEPIRHLDPAARLKPPRFSEKEIRDILELREKWQRHYKDTPGMWSVSTPSLRAWAALSCVFFVAAGVRLLRRIVVGGGVGYDGDVAA